MMTLVCLGLPALVHADDYNYTTDYSSTNNYGWNPYYFGKSIEQPIQRDASPNVPDNEIGLRYWYTSGDISYRVSKPEISSLDYKVDNSEAGELFFYLTSTHSRYLFKGVLGLGGNQDGNVDDSDYNTNGSKGSDTNSVLGKGRLFYGYADVGYRLDQLSSSTANTSILGGAGYIDDVMTARGVTCKITGNGDFTGECNAGNTLAPANVKALGNEAEWTIFRLGLENRWEPTRYITWHNELVGIPLANFTNLDSHYLRTDLGDNTPNITDHGWGYGFQAESSLEFRLSRAWSMNFGGRYWELFSDQTKTKIGNPSTASENSYGWDYQRWGLFVGTGYHF